jgi:hypothetical protein
MKLELVNPGTTSWLACSLYLLSNTAWFPILPKSLTPYSFSKADRYARNGKALPTHVLFSIMYRKCCCYLSTSILLQR